MTPEISPIAAPARLPGLALALHPSLAHTVAWRRFSRPPRTPPGPRELAGLKEARTGSVQGLPTFRWGRGPSVLLVHGWGGHAGQMAELGQCLAASGFEAVAFDAPAHGGAPGRACTFRDLRDALRAVGTAAGPLAGTVAHSLGCVASLAARGAGFDTGPLALLAPPLDVEDHFHHLAQALGIPLERRRALRRHVESRLGHSLAEVRLSALARHAPGPGQVLLLHDERDAEAPILVSELLAARLGCPFLRSRGLGHRRLLRAPWALAQVQAFLAARVPSAAVH